MKFVDDDDDDDEVSIAAVLAHGRVLNRTHRFFPGSGHNHR